LMMVRHSSNLVCQPLRLKFKVQRVNVSIVLTVDFRSVEVASGVG